MKGLHCLGSLQVPHKISQTTPNPARIFNSDLQLHVFTTKLKTWFLLISFLMDFFSFEMVTVLYFTRKEECSGQSKFKEKENTPHSQHCDGLKNIK